MVVVSLPLPRDKGAALGIHRNVVTTHDTLRTVNKGEYVPQLVLVDGDECEGEHAVGHSCKTAETLNNACSTRNAAGTGMTLELRCGEPVGPHSGASSVKTHSCPAGIG